VERYARHSPASIDLLTMVSEARLLAKQHRAEYNIDRAAPAVGLGMGNDQLSHAHMHWTSKGGRLTGLPWLDNARISTAAIQPPPRANSYPFFALRHAKFLLFLLASC
jgi:hypothetical protein